MTRSTPLLLPLLLLIAAPAPVRAGDAPSPERFTGSYLHAGGPREVEALETLVDDVVADFNPLLRGIARRRLERSVQVPERIEIASQAGQLSLRVIGAPDFPHSPPHYEAGALVLRQSSFEGSRETSFRLSPDGRVLTMHVATRSALLPEDLDYELTFSRRPDAPPSVSAPGPGSPTAWTADEPAVDGG